MVMLGGKKKKKKKRRKKKGGGGGGGEGEREREKQSLSLPAESSGTHWNKRMHKGKYSSFKPQPGNWNWLLPLCSL